LITPSQAARAPIVYPRRFREMIQYPGGHAASLTNAATSLNEFELLQMMMKLREPAKYSLTASNMM
jgi:hypothetical protein